MVAQEEDPDGDDSLGYGTRFTDVQQFASNGGLFHGPPNRAFQRIVELARDRGNRFVTELSEQGRRFVVFEDRGTVFVFIENDAQRRV